MAYEIANSAVKITLVAGADLSAKQYYFVKINSSGEAVACSGATDKPIGVLYADRPEPSSLTVGEQDLTMLKALRNQLVMAIRLRTSQPLA